MHDSDSVLAHWIVYSYRELLLVARRLVPTAIALAVSAALLLTACGGSDDKSKESDEIPGTDHSSKSAVPSTSPSDDGVERPKITLPEDDKLVFEKSGADDARKAAVLKDNQEFIRATDDAIIRGVPDSDALKFYAKSDALKASVEWVQQFVDAGQSITGTVRYFNRQVTFLKDGSAGLTYCGDETKAYNKDRKTGKRTDGASSVADAYVFYNLRLEKDEKGVWQAAQMMSKRGAHQCR
ncbi:hypothetical protein [Streptomyces halobius]|uniref:Lipoprotein n=1 Tax=Streptomyces halobius TaxID=2879846 RepID=A0ABY4M7J8_9ACTN|nr:hypothetical protein [Streptomyces halobius]UQA93755.1 hypothetical protein K9S39_19475 [Streptomyces halobius]